MYFMTYFKFFHTLTQSKEMNAFVKKELAVNCTQNIQHKGLWQTSDNISLNKYHHVSYSNRARTMQPSSGANSTKCSPVPRVTQPHKEQCPRPNHHKMHPDVFKEVFGEMLAICPQNY